MIGNNNAFKIEETKQKDCIKFIFKVEDTNSKEKIIETFNLYEDDYTFIENQFYDYLYILNRIGETIIKHYSFNKNCIYSLLYNIYCN